MYRPRDAVDRLGIAPAYFPSPESAVGWRTATVPGEVRDRAGMDADVLDRAWAFVASLHADPALLVVRRGWLCCERYQGAVTVPFRDMHSCGKAFTGAWGAILDAVVRRCATDGGRRRRPACPRTGGLGRASAPGHDRTCC